ncbi:MAG TPA: RNA polymerase subunit sigma-70 [Planctomycetales bacterium]|jgi:RNA polymerase sigma-70 factor (ECF subfamily)|nr:RNA polymerase subunit sigma-70 [Planctomycetales bacterium]
MSDPADQLYERLLVLRCQTGDEAAFTALVERYTPRLRYYLWKMLGDGKADVEGVLQQVWFDVFRAAPRLADPAAFPAWLYRIARNRTALRHRNKPRPSRPLAEDDLADGSDDEDYSTADAERVHAALIELAPEHREVLVLRFLEGMSYEDVAQVVGSPLGTVRSRIHYAKRALRRVLERMNNRE